MNPDQIFNIIYIIVGMIILIAGFMDHFAKLTNGSDDSDGF